MEQDDDWNRLIEALNTWTGAAEFATGQIEVSLPHGEVARRVVILMSPGQWGDMVGVMWGNFDDAIQDVKRTLLGLQPDESFAVYSEYRLEPATSTALEEESEFAPEPDGEWVGRDREGRIVSRYADWSEPDSRS